MVALAVGMMIFTIISVSTFDRADRNLFGYKAFIVLSDSMKKTDFDAGDLVLGKYSSRIPKVGAFFQFLKSTPGYIVCILIPLEGIRCIRLFRKYKAEQQAELQAERDKIEADRAETQRMKQELLAMKAQMAQNGGKTPKTDEAPSDTTAV